MPSSCAPASPTNHRGGVRRDRGRDPRRPQRQPPVARGNALAWAWPERDALTPVHRLAMAAAELVTDA
jgi:hypothetical protein